MVVNEWTDSEVDRIFQALADATRRDIVARAMRRDQSVSALARHYAMSFAAVQKHVAVLERADLVTKERRGREQIVHGNVAALRKAAHLLDAYEDIWRGRAERIGELLSGPKVSRPEVSRPEVSRPEVSRPEVSRPEVSTSKEGTEP